MEIRYLPLYLQSRLENFAKVRNKRELTREELFLKQIRYRQLNHYKTNQSQTDTVSPISSTVPRENFVSRQANSPDNSSALIISVN